MNGFTSIGQTLKDQPQDLSKKGLVLILQLGKELHQILPKVTPELSGEVTMHSFQDGCLILASPSPAISQEMFLHRDQVRKLLNAKLGGGTVEEIKVRTKKKD